MRPAVLAACLLALAAAPAGAASEPLQKRRPSLTPTFVQLDTIPATIIQSGRPKGLLLVDFGLDVPEGADRDRLEAELPRFLDTYVRVLTAHASLSGDVRRPPDVAVIADKLQSATDRILGPGRAKVLLLGVAIRRTR